MTSSQVPLTLLALVVSVMALAATTGSKRPATGHTVVSETGTELNMVEDTPMSADELAIQPQGQSQLEPGADKFVAGETGKQPLSDCACEFTNLHFGLLCL